MNLIYLGLKLRTFQMHCTVTYTQSQHKTERQSTRHTQTFTFPTQWYTE